MREILFKAKIKSNGKWVEGFYCSKRDTTYCFTEDYESNPVETHHYILQDQMTDWGLPNQLTMYEIDPTTLCQFTGMTDKNGKKIWENDIVQTNGCLTWLIAYDKNAFVCKDSSMETYFALFEQWDYDWKNKVDISTSDRFEVIGNVFDNPELLT